MTSQWKIISIEFTHINLFSDENKWLSIRKLISDCYRLARMFTLTSVVCKRFMLLYAGSTFPLVVYEWVHSTVDHKLRMLQLELFIIIIHCLLFLSMCIETINVEMG